MAMPIASLSLASVDSVCTSLLEKFDIDFDWKQRKWTLTRIIDRFLLDASPQARVKIPQLLDVRGHWTVILDGINDARVDSLVERNCFAPVTVEKWKTFTEAQFQG